MPNVSVPIALQHRDEIIRRISHGETAASIAKELGCHKSQITRGLKDDPEYLEAQIEYHATRLDTAEQMILDAATHDDATSRASRASAAAALWKAYSWRAEREQRRIWGQQDDRSGGGVTIVINTQDSTGRIIQGEGGVVKAGVEVGEGNPSCMPSSTDRDSSTDNTVLIQDNSESPK